MDSANNQHKLTKIIESLRKEKDRFQYAIDRCPIPIVISDNNDKNLYVNLKFTEILGYTLEEVPDSESWVKLAYPNREYLKIIEAKTPDITPILTKPRINDVRCKDGRIRNIQFQDIALNNDEFLTVLVDVSERLKTVESLKQNLQNFRKIVEFFPYPIIMSNKKRDAEYFNPRFIKLFGYTIDDLPNNEEWIQNIYPDPKYRDKIRLETRLSNYSREKPRERKITCKSGEIKYVILQDITIDEEHDITIFRDITAQRKAEMQSLEKEREYREIFENSRDMIFVIDKKIRIQKFNPIVTEILGFSEEELIGHSVIEFIPPEFHTLIRSTIKAYFTEHKEISTFEIDLKKKDRSRLSIEVIVRLIIREGTFVGTLIICRDISIRKRINAERFRQQKIESIGVLAGGLAHDFNNILVSIMGNINLLQMEGEQLSPEQEEILKEMESGAFQARDLTRQLLTFSKGGTPITKPESIEDLIQGSANFILRGSKSKCVFHFEPQLPSVEIDAGQINQVLNNILINSSQAMLKGGIIDISVSVETILKDSLIPLKRDQYILISIKDTGIGITKSIQNKIFDPYFTTKQAGTGLGLTMSYSIIKKHNGYITFSSEEGKGSTFYLYLPISKKKTNEKVSQKQKIEKSSGKILVLDDNPKIHQLLNRVFSRFGLEMESCYDGSEVLEKYTIAEQMGTPFDLIFMDLTIPGGIGGKDSLLILKKHYPKVKVIVISGYSNDPILANFKDYGFTDCLEKPFTIDQLREILKKWIK